MRNKVAQWANGIKHHKWVWEDVYSTGRVKHLATLLNEIVPTSLKNIHGAHFIFNNQSNENLGLDGYDNYQAPMAESGEPLYSRRMWVNGHLEFFQPPKLNGLMRCTEQIKAVRTIGKSVFVSVNRDFADSSGSPILRELRTLVYTNERYVKPETADRLDEVAGKIIDKSIVSISLAQVMRHCSLSYNLHKIHYDAQFCHSEGLENVIASGPLIVLILLQFFGSHYPNAVVKSFKYRNSEPCYIDEEVELVLLEENETFELSMMKNGRKLCSGILIVEI